LSSIDGIVLLNKPAGITSFRSLNAVKKCVKGSKVGHAGTLDKFANGLVLTLVGGFTRLNPYFSGMDKSYTGVVRLGKETATLDPEGDVLHEGDIPSDIDWNELLNCFKGKQQQIPPQYSAVHVEGKRAYKRTLAGEVLEMPPRDIVIHEIKFIAWESPFLTIEVTCSKGTYIRSLARDIGRAAGTFGYLEALQRTSIGDFSLNEAIDPECFDSEKHVISGRKVFDLLPGIGILEITEEAAKLIQNGVQVRPEFLLTPPEEDGVFALFLGPDYKGVVEYTKGRYKYKMVKGS